MGKVVAFVPVRLTSSRLPEKHLRMLGDRPVLSWVLKRLKESATIDNIVVCAPDESASELLRDFCKSENVELFLFDGFVNDVVGRLTAAAIAYGAEICVLGSGDCPLLNPESIDKLVNVLLRDAGTGIALHKVNNGRPTIHEGAIVMRRAVWELANRESDLPELREHQFPVVFLRPEKFKSFNMCNVDDVATNYRIKHRISIDTPSDLKFHLALHGRLQETGRAYNLDNAVALLCEEPKILDLNLDVRQKGLKDGTARILFVVTAVMGYGYGNLTRSMELANTLIDKYGTAVEFKVLDDTAVALLKEHHLQGGILAHVSDLVRLAHGYDAMIFDVNSKVEYPNDLLNSIRQDSAVVVIDNIQTWARSADKLIIPTAHYTGPQYDNLVHGAPYVIIRRDVQKQARKLNKRAGTVLVDSRIEGFREKALPYIDELTKTRELDLEFIETYAGDFLEKLARSEYFVSPLSVSAYESLYLGVKPVVVPLEQHEHPDAVKFMAFATAGGKGLDGMGASRIADTVMELVAERKAQAMP